MSLQIINHASSLLETLGQRLIEFKSQIETLGTTIVLLSDVKRFLEIPKFQTEPTHEACSGILEQSKQACSHINFASSSLTDCSNSYTVLREYRSTLKSMNGLLAFLSRKEENLRSLRVFEKLSDFIKMERAKIKGSLVGYEKLAELIMSLNQECIRSLMSILINLLNLNLEKWKSCEKELTGLLLEISSTSDALLLGSWACLKSIHALMREQSQALGLARTALNILRAPCLKLDETTMMKLQVIPEFSETLPRIDHEKRRFRRVCLGEAEIDLESYTDPIKLWEDLLHRSYLRIPEFLRYRWEQLTNRQNPGFSAYSSIQAFIDDRAKINEQYNEGSPSLVINGWEIDLPGVQHSFSDLPDFEERLDFVPDHPELLNVRGIKKLRVCLLDELKQARQMGCSSLVRVFDASAWRLNPHQAKLIYEETIKLYFNLGLISFFLIMI